MLKLIQPSQILPRYRALLLDAYGVLRNAEGPFEGAEAWLGKLATPYWILTNDASIPPGEIARKLGRGVKEAQILSCGSLLTQALKELPPRSTVAYLGKFESAYYITQAGMRALAVSEIRNPGDVAAIVVLDDEGFDWERDLNRSLNLVREFPQILTFAPNCDLLYQRRAGELGIAPGAIAELLARVTGREFVSFGKPLRPIFDQAFELARARIPDLERSEVLMVGDTLETDIAGARAAGFDTLLVLSGNAREEDVAKAPQVQTPTFIAKSLLH